MKYLLALFVVALLVGLSASEAYADNSNTTGKVVIKRNDKYSFCTDKATVRFYEEANFSGGCKAFKNGEVSMIYPQPQLDVVRTGRQLLHHERRRA